MRAPLTFFIAMLPWVLVGCGNSDSTSTATTEPPAAALSRVPVEALDTNQYTFTAWRTATGTDVQFSDNAAGLEFYRYRDADCDVSNVLLCDTGAVDTLADPPTAISDTAATVAQTAHYQLGTEGGLMRTTIAADDVSFWGSMGVLGFDDQFWKLGPLESGGSDAAVAVSNDGQSWELVTSSVPFGTRGKAVVYDDALWVVDADTDMDVHRSTDGSTWTEIATGLSMDPRSNYALQATNDALYLVGGSTYDPADSTYSSLNDIWRSADGVVWEELSHDLPEPEGSFTGGNGIQVSTHNNSLFAPLPGESDEATNTQGAGALYTSDDGESWSEVNVGIDGNFTRLFSFRDKLWGLFTPAGESFGSEKLLISDDGLAWGEADLESFNAFSFNSVVVSGSTLLDWNAPAFSLDGLTWAGSPAPTPIGQSDSAGHWSYGDTLFLLQHGNIAAGSDFTLYKSTDATSWEEVGPGFPGNTQVIEVGSTLYAHVTDVSVPTSRFYSSSDGENWTELQSDVFGGQTKLFSSLSHVGGKFYIFGGVAAANAGYGNNSTMTSDADSDVWESSDGVTWTKLTTSGSEPSYIYEATVLPVGTDLFIFDSVNNERLVFQFNPTTTTWTEYDGSLPVPEHSAPYSGNGMDTLAIFREDDGTLVWINSGSTTESRTSTDGINWTTLNTGGETFAAFSNWPPDVFYADSYLYLRYRLSFWRSPLTANFDEWDKIRTGILVELAE